MDQDSVTAVPFSHLKCFQKHISVCCLAVLWKNLWPSRLPLFPAEPISQNQAPPKSHYVTHQPHTVVDTVHALVIKNQSGKPHTAKPEASKGSQQTNKTTGDISVALSMIFARAGHRLKKLIPVPIPVPIKWSRYQWKVFLNEESLQWLAASKIV